MCLGLRENVQTFVEGLHGQVELGLPQLIQLTASDLLDEAVYLDFFAEAGAGLLPDALLVRDEVRDALKLGHLCRLEGRFLDFELEVSIAEEVVAGVEVGVGGGKARVGGVQRG